MKKILVPASVYSLQLITPIKKIKIQQKPLYSLTLFYTLVIVTIKELYARSHTIFKARAVQHLFESS